MMDITKKMNRTAAGLESDPRSDGHLLYQAYARVAPPVSDVKVKVNVEPQKIGQKLCSKAVLTSIGREKWFAAGKKTK